MMEANNDINNGETKYRSEKPLARQLLMSVLSLYFLVAAFSTAGHLYIQYQREKSNLLKMLHEVETLLASNLAAAIWDYSTTQLVLCARSVLEVPLLSGISIEDNNKEIIFRAGEVITPKGKVVHLNDKGEPEKELGTESLIEHFFELNYKLDDKIFPVGRVRIFANHQHLVNALRNSLLITVMTALLQATAVALALTLALSRGLRRPLQRLMGQLDQIDFSSSDLPRISSERLKGAELLRLQRALNNSLERIDKSRMALEVKNRDLDEINQNLEQTVEERTAELSAAYMQISNELAVRKQIEEELIIAKQNAEAASKAKSLFINNMSHELRTPLNGIIASSELALGQEISSKVANHLKTVQRSGRALLKTVSAIVDFSRSEDGKLELKSIPFRLDEILGKLPCRFVQKGTEKKIEISFDIAVDEISNALIGDPDRLLEIFNHLLDNTAKFSTGIPKVVIGIKDVDKSAEKTILEFYVLYNGIGIASKDFEKIFEAFTQIDASKKRRYDGTGMGLTISKRLVAGIGGTIWVESKLGKGSTFYFTASFGRQDKECPFQMPVFEDQKNPPIKQLNNKTSGEMGSQELLIELLSKIDPFVQQHKPKPCKEIMKEINSYSWPDEYTQDIAEIGRLIGKYKFKIAYTILESLMEKLKS